MLYSLTEISIADDGDAHRGDEEAEQWYQSRPPPPLPETRLALSAPCHVVRLRLAEEFVSS